ncbi:fumarylacetoacetate hydrolase family protein [Neorhizobium galegae]|uniref:fumarylacetoacetate hydrolase family protein n=1 Tax=Neorhizobium galegae TaxID=399 RepID=UPI00358EC20A
MRSQSRKSLIAHAAKTRALCAGTIIGSGTVSNLDPDGGPGRPVNDGGMGYSCISELRVVETIREGKPQSEYMKNGENIRIEMQDTQRKSIFGAINQKVMVTKPQLSE